MAQTTNTLCVVDASVTAGWLVEAQATPYKTSVLNTLYRYKGAGLVPSLWHLEVANLIAIRFKRGLASLDVSEKLSLYAENLPVVTDDFEMTNATRAKNWRISRVFDLAAKQDLTSYDAIYLQTAIRSGLPLATTDEALMQAAKRCGVQIFQP
jgi:predicted nucleic acid-binding protein